MGRRYEPGPGYCLARKLPPEKTFVSGGKLEKPGQFREDTYLAKILIMGPPRLDNTGKPIPLFARDGDIIVMSSHAPAAWPDPGDRELVLLAEQNICCRVILTDDQASAGRV